MEETWSAISFSLSGTKVMDDSLQGGGGGRGEGGGHNCSLFVDPIWSNVTINRKTRL